MTGTGEAPIWFDDVHVGLVLTGAVVEVTPAQLFFFSAATYNGHRIHYDRSWAVDVEQHDDLLVQGPLQAALLLRVVTDWLPAHGQLLDYSYEHRGSAFPGEPLRTTGVVSATTIEGDRGLVDIDLQLRNGTDRILVPGSARVLLPRRSTTQ